MNKSPVNWIAGQLDKSHGQNNQTENSVETFDSCRECGTYYTYIFINITYFYNLRLRLDRTVNSC